jgi:hypothetical protein
VRQTLSRPSVFLREKPNCESFFDRASQYQEERIICQKGVSRRRRRDYAFTAMEKRERPAPDPAE